MKSSLTVIETGEQWLLSFDGNNPSRELSFEMPKEEAFRLMDLLAPMFPSVYEESLFDKQK